MEGGGAEGISGFSYGLCSILHCSSGMTSELFPYAMVKHIAGAGHLLHVERPNDVIEAINAFISSQKIM